MRLQTKLILASALAFLPSVTHAFTFTLAGTDAASFLTYMADSSNDAFATGEVTVRTGSFNTTNLSSLDQAGLASAFTQFGSDQSFQQRFSGGSDPDIPGVIDYVVGIVGLNPANGSLSADVIALIGQPIDFWLTTGTENLVLRMPETFAADGDEFSDDQAVNKILEANESNATLLLGNIGSAIDLSGGVLPASQPYQTVAPQAGGSAPSFSVQPDANTTVDIGTASPSLNLSATVSDAVSYQWFFTPLGGSQSALTDGISDGIGTVSGATTDSLTVSDIEFDATGTFMLRATNATGDTDSDDAVVSVENQNITGFFGSGFRLDTGGTIDPAVYYYIDSNGGVNGANNADYGFVWAEFWIKGQGSYISHPLHNIVYLNSSSPSGEWQIYDFGLGGWTQSNAAVYPYIYVLSVEGGSQAESEGVEAGDVLWFDINSGDGGNPRSFYNFTDAGFITITD